MASRSSSDHPESSHPYHTDRSRLTTSLESQGRRRSGFLSRFLSKTRREDLLPLPEGASPSLSSPPRLQPLSPLQSLDLPHPASTDTTGITARDSTWAATYESPPLPPMTILGMPILQHPQPQSVPVSSEITSPSPSAPTSLTPATACLSTEPLPRHQSISSMEELCQSGTSPYKMMTGSHPSLYERSLSRVDQPSPNPMTAATGHTSSSHAHHHEGLEYTEGKGNESPDSSDQSHNLHQSYSRPPSRDTMSTSPMRPLERAPSRSFTDQPRYSQTRHPSLMEEQIPSRPPSRRACQPSPTLPAMTLPDAIKFYQETATDLSIAIPVELHNELSIASFITIMLTSYHSFWLGGETQAGNDYFMKRNRGLPADDILRYEAEWNARLLYNEVHRNASMEEFPPYEDIAAEADIQLPMPDEPPIPPSTCTN